jgi:hypothetical protein
LGILEFPFKMSSFASTEIETQMPSSITTDSISSDYSIDVRHQRAIMYMRACLDCLRNLPSRDSIAASGISDETSTHLRGFKTRGLNFQMLLQLLVTLESVWASFESFEGKKNVPKVQQRKKNLSVSWNKNLNKLRGRLTEESLLNDLMFINGHHGLYEPKEGEPRTFIDIQTLDANEEADVRLHLNTGRIFADSTDTMCSRLFGLLESVHNPHNLIVEQYSSKKSLDWVGNVRHTTFGVSLTVQWADPDTFKLSERTSGINTNEPKFLQHFLGGNFPGYREVQRLLGSSRPEDLLRYGTFYQLVRLMKVKIFELINLSTHIPTALGSRFAVIRCPRSDPRPCGCETVIQKPSSRAYAHRCTSCTMEICPWGCGRAHHGGDCEVPPDQASAEFIEQTTKRCRGCNQAVHKYDGCNHITCRCRIEFCYICGEVYERDEHGHYQVTEHHRDLGGDGRPRCPQFDH